MALNKQIHIYSVDTGAFYTNKEEKMHRKMLRYSKFKNIIKKIKTDKYTDKQLEYYNNIKKGIYKDFKICKEVLLEMIEANKEKRELNNKKLNTKNVISVFDSTLTRTIGMQENELYNDIIVVQTYFYGIVENLINNGFDCNGEKYVFFSASAGQIRTKKNVFIKEEILNKYEKTLMCGLTLDEINRKGGINVNKYLAYLALSNSATDEWKDFDINRCIVVDDFETMVNGEVDFIDDTTYEITRKVMDVPITHSDGCGLILNGNKNFMVRLPWVKGLLAAFNYVDFIRENNANTKIKDIYGKEYDILKDNIQIIFTKSQFKMYKYYDSWDEYKIYFKNFNCQASICNMEEDKISNAKLNYQMLQTLTDITEDELTTLLQKSQNKIDNIATTVESMLNAFGVTKYNINKTPLQEALEIYPELLTDIYTKEVISKIKKSLVKDYKSAKLEIDGKYTFLIPDLYAFCEYLFLDIKQPKGLLKNGEVYCSLFSKYDKLDCLRSPHLYKEHAVRKNIIDDNKSKWFITKAIYTSSHDLISKILQFDNDGDKSLVIADKLFCSIAERNMNEVVPLFYNMRKADAMIVDSKKIYMGLNAAYKGSKIGLISNDITKIWNHENIRDEKFKDEAIKVIKLLCMENNFTIDYAKTLYKPERPDHINLLIKKYTKAKTPFFFIHAKDKKIKQVEKVNKCTVNRICKKIKDTRIKYKVENFGVFDYKTLMNYANISIDDELINKYIELNQKYHFKINMESEYKSNISFVAKEIRNELNKINNDDVQITDMLIKYLYDVKNSKSKESLWFCYGNIIVDNLKRNIGENSGVCQCCGARFIKKVPYHKYCDKCAGYQKMGKKTIICVDCGKEVIIDSKDNKTCRCENHSKEHKREIDRIRKQKQREHEKCHANN